MAYDGDYSYGYPIMGPIWKHCCHFCRRDLREVPKDHIVKGEVWWGYDEQVLKRYWYCNKDCARKEYWARANSKKEAGASIEKLNQYIKEER